MGRSRAGSIHIKPKPRGKPFTGINDPRRHPGFPPGICPNPGGRPKNQGESAAYIAHRLREEFLDVLVDTIKVYAAKGSSAHMIEALNRVAGKVVDKTELSGPAGGAIPLEVTEALRAKMQAKIEALGGITAATVDLIAEDEQ
jgi:hypothetical protein